MICSVTQRKVPESYQESQEKIVKSLLDQVGDGYTAARLQITLQHINLIPKHKKSLIRLDDIY